MGKFLIINQEVERKMKKIIIVLFLFMSFFCLVSCAADRKAWSQATTYKDPQTIGGYWDVTMQTGQSFNHVKCIYWGTNDDTSVFQMDDGTIICQSGAVVCIKCK